MKHHNSLFRNILPRNPLSPEANCERKSLFIKDMASISTPALNCHYIIQ